VNLPNGPTGDPLWDLATKIIEKRVKPGGSIKSILKDIRTLYAGLKREAPKSLKQTSLELVSKWLRTEAELKPKTRPAKLRTKQSLQ
jgi:hypothetical protein